MLCAFILYKSVYTITTTSIACSIFFPAYNLFVSNNTCSIGLYSYFLHTQRVFTQDWLSYYYLSSALFLSSIVQHKQSNESSWSRTFVFWLSRELYCNFFVVCVDIVVCEFAYLSITFSVMLNFIQEWRDLLFKVDSEPQIF